MNSLDLAGIFKKSHNHVLRDIRRVIERSPELESFVAWSFHRTRGKEYPMYILDKKLFEIMKLKYELRFASSIIESQYLEVICGIFPNEAREFQKSFCNGKYEVDLFFTDLRIIVEIDEKDHEYTKMYDEIREKEICDNLIEQLKADDHIEREEDFDYSKWFKFVRIKEGKLGEGLKDLMIAIENVTWRSPCDYMK